MATRTPLPGRAGRRDQALGLIASLVALLLVVAGCAADPPPPTPDPASTVGEAPPAVLAASHPQRLLIPKIGVDAGLIDLGLQPDGSMEVPADGSLAGWYTHSPTPGELGPAVLAAHVDWKGARGVFYDLKLTQPGDPIEVRRADGSTATFTVRRVEQYPKANFPSGEVYGDVDTAQLRLITCGGEFDSTANSYRDNIVVYAELSP